MSIPVKAFRLFPGSLWPYAKWYNEDLDQLGNQAAEVEFKAGRPLFYTMPAMGDELIQITYAPLSGATPKIDRVRPYVALSELHFPKGAK